MSEILTCAIVGHLVGDYLLQNDWMALNKKKPGLPGALPCLVHATLWTLAVGLFTGWSCCVLLLLWQAHFWQDRTNVVGYWMELIGQHEFRSGACAPWSIIVVDNVWHILTLFAVWRFW